MPHNSHNSESRSALIITGLLLAIFAISINISWPYIHVISSNYALFHAILEIIIIVMASLIFGIVWGIRQEKPSSNLILFACMFLCVAILDMAHLLSYKGMPEFITPGSRENLFIFGRLHTYLVL